MRKNLRNIIARALLVCSMTFAASFAGGMDAFADGWKTTDEINVRSSMDLSDDPMGKLSEGSYVDIVEVSSDGAWAEINYEGTTGYILTMYLTEGDVEASSDDTETKTEPKTGRRIIIDAGHGGDDPGAVAEHNGVSYEEADYALAISQYLQEELEAMGFDVIMTRDGDINITLKERVEMANSSNADLFFSLHHNAAPESVSGALTIYPESKSNGDEGAVEESKNIAYMISEAYQGTGMGYNGIYADVDISGYPLYVLTNSNMVSILTEMGFITNSGDAALISDPAFQRQLAKNFAHEIYIYFN